MISDFVNDEMSTVSATRDFAANHKKHKQWDFWKLFLLLELVLFGETS